MPIDWDNLSQYKASKNFLPGYPDDWRSFYSPIDDLHGVLKEIISSAEHSIILNMFGYDDDELDEIISGKLSNSNIYIQMSLDRRQAGGVHEKKLLEHWANQIGNSIAVGNSVKSAISHLKVCIIDGIYSIRGSTNWSLSGEQKQDNELIITRHPVVAAELRTILDINHDAMLQQMKKRGEI